MSAISATNAIMAIMFALLFLVMIFFLESLRPSRRIPAIAVFLVIAGILLAIASVLSLSP